ncbi:MAG TPA: MarR family transcriptional regulator [Gammaproteobacteria bacterium]|nr:MarR family transcriptional regulator [Gammaproteobacteria bacterium]
MVDQKKLPEDAQQRLNEALEGLYFGFRAITAQPDARLSELGYSRVHHRILYFVGRNSGCSINELLAIMRVSKQYLHGPLKKLIDDDYIAVKRDPGDRRVKRLRLTSRGRRLEDALTGEQRRQLKAVFEEAGPRAETGWREVMALLARSRDE